MTVCESTWLVRFPLWKCGWVFIMGSTEVFLPEQYGCAHTHNGQHRFLLWSMGGLTPTVDSMKRFPLWSMACPAPSISQPDIVQLCCLLTLSFRGEHSHCFVTTCEGNVKIEWVMDMCMQICFHVKERVVISIYCNRHRFAAKLNFLNFQFNKLSDTSPLFASVFFLFFFKSCVVKTHFLACKIIVWCEQRKCAFNDI